MSNKYSYNKVFFFIHDGFYCAHTGAGIHNFRIMRILREVFPFSDIFICPIFTSEKSFDFQTAWHANAVKIVERDNLKVRPVDNDTDGMNRYGGLLEWSRGSNEAAALLKNTMTATDNVLCISIDTSFIELVTLLGSENQVTHLHIPQGTGMLHDPANQARLQLEREIFSCVPSNTKIGAIGDFMFDHLMNDYGIADGKMIFARNGCLPEDNITLTANERESLAKRWRINDGRQIIAAYGRSIEYKGFHTLVEAMCHLSRDKYRLIVNATTDNEDSEIYKERLVATASRMNVDLTLHSSFDPLFPSYIRRHPQTLAVVVPSIHEPFGLIPSETMYDPASRAIVISSNADGLGSQLIHAQTGLLFSANDIDELAQTLKIASRLIEKQRRAMVLRAHESAIGDFDLRHNFRKGVEAIK